MKPKHTILPALAVLAMIGAADAATITTASGGSAFAVSSGDLLQTSLASTIDNLIYNPSYNTLGEGAGGSESDLRNGNSTVGVMIGNGSTGGSITFNLDLVSSPLGYSVTEINTYTSHGDGGRDGQDYTVSYALVGSPTSFIDIASVGEFGGNGTPGSGKVAITDIGITNVAAVRFSFGGQENSGTNFRELDVIGSAVPEPSAALLGGFGLLALLRRRR
jgi:hypothetical protein